MIAKRDQAPCNEEVKAICLEILNRLVIDAPTIWPHWSSTEREVIVNLMGSAYAVGYTTAVIHLRADNISGDSSEC